MPQAVVSPESGERGMVSRLASSSCFTRGWWEGDGKQAFWCAQATAKAAAWMEANDSVVCHRCTKYIENSGPDVGRTWRPLSSAHFCHAEKAAEFFLTVLGALSWMMIPGIASASERMSGRRLYLRFLRVGAAGKETWGSMLDFTKFEIAKANSHPPKTPLTGC